MIAALPVRDGAAAARWRGWLPFVAVALVYAVVTAHRIELPSLFADAVNPDYLAASLLSAHPERGIVWVLFGNSLLGDRAPVLISLYHGSQQYWLGLPFYAVFGTGVTGVRLTHAMFALFVLAALHALLLRGGLRPWLAAAVGAALAVDPAFSYAFRTQAYITVAPAAWLLLSLVCLSRAPEAAKPARWLFASGALCGLAAVGYFVWAFVLPPIAFAASRWMRGVPLARPAWLTWTRGLATGSVFYPIGYLLIARKLGSFTGMVDFVREQQAHLGAFRSALPPGERLAHAWRTLDAVVNAHWHSAIMFGGEIVPAPAPALKVALLVGLPYLLWGAAEATRRATPVQRLLVALPVSFVACALVFGDRLGGHHFVTLVPLLYAALGVGLATLLPARGLPKCVGVVAPVVALAAMNVLGQERIADTLAQTRGRGFLSDAIHRFADDLNAMERKPFLWFAEPALALPVIMITRAGIPVSDRIDDPDPRRALCSGRDVLMVRVPNHHSEPRGREWLAKLGWDAPVVTPYAQADGAVVFEVLAFRGRRDGPGCADAGAVR
ncbi:MAG: hypothetical protein U1F15_07340 [Burkholderiales bacterium]